MECRACFKATDQEFELCNSCKKKKKSSKNWMICGLGAMILGITSSILSFYSALEYGGTYTIFYGFIIGSLMTFIKGFAEWLYFRKKEKEVQQFGNIKNEYTEGINEDALKRYLSNKKSD